MILSSLNLNPPNLYLNYDPTNMILFFFFIKNLKMYIFMFSICFYRFSSKSSQHKLLSTLRMRVSVYDYFQGY